MAQELLKKLIRKVKALLPSKLPQGVQEFHRWADDIIDLYGMPRNDSMKFALATMMINYQPTVLNKYFPLTIGYLSKARFGHELIKAAATEIAVQVFTDLKQAELAARKAKNEKVVEATTVKVASDVSKQ